MVDSEGFPRGDIDLYAVRAARAELSRLGYDLKQTTALVESSIQQIHAQAKVEGNSSVGTRLNVPFARVNGVAPDSPACTAGLMRGDEIFR